MDANKIIQTVRDAVRPDRITPRDPPLQITDENSREIELRPYRESDFESLVGMYADFESAGRAQGVPPLDTPAIREWLDGILGGLNVVACHGEDLVGHVSVVPDGTDRHEIAIFVHQAYQRAGIGSSLLAAGMGQAKRAGVTYVWLSVEASSRELHRFYTRAGFTTVNPMGMTNRMSRYL